MSNVYTVELNEDTNQFGIIDDRNRVIAIIVGTAGHYEQNAELFANAPARADSAEATAAELREQLKAVTADMRRACDLAGIIDGDANTLTDWIVGAQSEIANMAGQLRDIWAIQEKYMQGTLSVSDVTVSAFERTAPLDWRDRDVTP